MPGGILMDLLPGPTEDASLDALTAFVSAHCGLDNAAARLRADAPPAPDLLADADAAGLFAPVPVTTAAVVAVELGRVLAPLEVVAGLVAGAAPAALAGRRHDGSYALVGGPDPATVTVFTPDADPGVARAVPRVVRDAVPSLDPLIPLRVADLDDVDALPDGEAQRATLLVAAVHAGLARGALELAAAHAAVREQFGRPIGANQAVKHLCADAATRAEAAWASVLYAATWLAEDRPDPGFPVGVAARIAAAAATANGRTTIQVHGGRGYTLEHPAHLFLARAEVLEHVTAATRRARRALLAHEPSI